MYNVEEMPETINVSTPKQLKKLINEEGWEMAVRIHDEDEMLWLLYHIDGDTIKELFVVVLNEEELVLVKIRGKLERLVAHALSEPGTMKDISNWGDPF